MSNINVHFNPILELGACISRVVDESRYNESVKNSKHLFHPSITKAIEQLRIRTTTPLMIDAQYLFEHLGADALFVNLATRYQFNEWREANEYLERLNEGEWEYFLKESLLDLPDDQSDLVEKYTQEINTFMSDFKVMKDRLLHFIHRFYQKVYLPYYEEIKEYIPTYLSLYQKYALEDETRFKATLVRIQVENQEMVIHLYLNFAFELNGKYSVNNEKPDILHVIVGYIVWDFFTFKESIQVAEQTIKLLGEDTKMQIIQLLSKRAFYASEIAKELDLNRATISHHLHKLVSNGLIHMEITEGNKVYYRLDHNYLKSTFNAFLTSLENNKD